MRQLSLPQPVSLRRLPVCPATMWRIGFKRVLVVLLVFRADPLFARQVVGGCLVRLGFNGIKVLHAIGYL